MATFNRLVDEGKLATVTRNRSSCSTNINSNSTNRPGTEGAMEASGTTAAPSETAACASRTTPMPNGTTMANEVPTQTSGKIWTSNEFWEFVDTLLSQTRTAAVAQESTVQGQQKILETYVVIFSVSMVTPAHHPMTLTECSQSVSRPT